MTNTADNYCQLIISPLIIDVQNVTSAHKVYKNKFFYAIIFNKYITSKVVLLNIFL